MASFLAKCQTVMSTLFIVDLSCFRAVWMNVPGLIVIVTLCCLDGLVIFAVYSGCDLIKDNKITSNDQVKALVYYHPNIL